MHNIDKLGIDKIVTQDLKKNNPNLNCVINLSFDIDYSTRRIDPCERFFISENRS